MTPQAQNPIHPQNVRQARPTNSNGKTKFTTIVPVQDECIRDKTACQRRGRATMFSWRRENPPSTTPTRMTMKSDDKDKDMTQKGHFASREQRGLKTMDKGEYNFHRDD